MKRRKFIQISGSASIAVVSGLSSIYAVGNAASPWQYNSTVDPVFLPHLNQFAKELSIELPEHVDRIKLISGTVNPQKIMKEEVTSLGYILKYENDFGTEITLRKNVKGLSVLIGKSTG